MLRASVLSVLTVCAAGLVSSATAVAQSAAAPAAAAPAAASPTKVAVINLQRAVLGTAEIQKASNDLQAKYKPRQEALEKLQKELQDLQTQLQNGQGKLTAEKEADLQAEGQQKQRDAQRMSDDLQADVNRDRNQVLQRAQTRMYEVVKKMAEEKGFDVVVDSTNTFFYKPALDITEDAVKAYDKAYPVAATSASK
jgi:outer membrane protein